MQHPATYSKLLKTATSKGFQEEFVPKKKITRKPYEGEEEFRLHFNLAIETRYNLINLAG